MGSGRPGENPSPPEGGILKYLIHVATELDELVTKCPREEGLSDREYDQKVDEFDNAVHEFLHRNMPAMGAWGDSDSFGLAERVLGFALENSTPVEKE